MPKDNLDHVVHLMEQAGWSDGYIVELLLAYVSQKHQMGDLLAYLKKEREDELRNGTARKVG